MVRITDISGCIQVFTMSNGETLRVMAHSFADREDSLVDTAEIKNAQKLGVVLIQPLPVSEPEVKVPVNPKPLKKVNTNGGAE